MSDQAEQTMPVVVVLPAEIDVTNSELVLRLARRRRWLLACPS